MRSRKSTIVFAFFCDCALSNIWTVYSLVLINFTFNNGPIVNIMATSYIGRNSNQFEYVSTILHHISLCFSTFPSFLDFSSKNISIFRIKTLVWAFVPACSPRSSTVGTGFSDIEPTKRLAPISVSYECGGYNIEA